jgi:hypothetical protein
MRQRAGGVLVGQVCALGDVGDAGRTQGDRCQRS